MTSIITNENSGLKGYIRPEEAEPYFKKTKYASVVQQLAREVPLTENGSNIPVIATKPTAGWVGAGDPKPVTTMGMDVKSIQPRKLAAIAVVAAEVVRRNPFNYMNLLVDEIGEAFAKAFDAAVLFGTNNPFGSDNHIAATTKTVQLGTAGQNKGGMYADINEGLKLLLQADKELTGFAFGSKTEADFNAAVDANGRPLFVESPTVTESAGLVREGRLLGRPAYLGRGAGNDTIAGFAGDWSQVVWGTTGGISFDVSTDATIEISGKQVSMFQNNLLAIRAEAEYGVVVADKDAFVKYTTTG